MAGEIKRIIDLPTDHNPAASDYIAIDGATTRATQLQDLIKPIPAFAGDSGSGGTKGLVPAPAAGDAAAGKVLGSGGGWVFPPSAGALGQCRLVKSGANIVLQTVNGNLITINGSNQIVPSAGVSLAPTGLTPSTLYYIYAYMNSGTMTLEASTTGKSTDTSTGVEIKSGDPTRSFVGWAYVITGPAFVDTDAQRLVVSWFNPRPISGTASFSTVRTSTSTSYAEVNSEIRVQFIARGNSATQFMANGGTYNSGANQTLTSIGIDSTSPRDVVSFGSGANAQSMALSHAETLAEGFHYVTIVGRVSAGTGSWYTNSNNAGERFTLKVVTYG